MDIATLGLVALVLCAACFCVWCMQRSSASRDRAVVDIIDRVIAYRGVNSPEAQAVATLCGTVAGQSEQLISFTAEGRDLLKHKETSREIIKTLETQLALQTRVLEQTGVRARVPEPVPMPPADRSGDVMEARFEERREL